MSSAATCIEPHVAAFPASAYLAPPARCASRLPLHLWPVRDWCILGCLVMAFASHGLPCQLRGSPAAKCLDRRRPVTASPAPISPCCCRRRPLVASTPPPSDEKPKKADGMVKAGAALDDFINKKYGRGYIFYGEKARDAEGDESVEEEDLGRRIPDGPPVLVIGASSPVGTWITLKLRTAGLPVRVLARSVKAVEEIFGPAGTNVTVVSGDVTSSESVQDALAGCRAVVVAVSGGFGSYTAVDTAGVANVAAAAATTPGVSRAVLLSRVSGVDGLLERFGGKQAAVRAGEGHLRDSAVPWTIVRAGRLTDEPGGRLRVEVTAPAEGEGGGGARGVSRMDVAEAVVQALVVEQGVGEDAGGGKRYGNALVEVINGTEVLAEGDELDWGTVYQQLEEE